MATVDVHPTTITSQADGEAPLPGPVAINPPAETSEAGAEATAVKTTHIQGEQQTLMLRAIFEEFPECVKLVNKAGKLLQMNPAGLRLLGVVDVASANSIGLMEFVHSEDRDAFRKLHLAVCDGHNGSLQFRIRANDGTTRTMACTSKPLRDSISGEIHHLGITRDVSNQVAAESALDRSRRRLQFAMEAAQIGEWTMDLETLRVERSASYARCFGYEDLQPTWNLEDFLEHVHPLDQARIAANARKAICGEPEDTEYRVVWPDGSVHWLWSSGVVHMNEHGTAQYLTGLLVDISERKRAEAAAEINYESWRMANQGTQDGLWDWNIRAGIVSYSESWAQMLGYEPTDLSNSQHEWFSRIHPDDRGFTEHNLQKVLDGSADNYTAAHRLRCKDGRWKWVLGRGAAIARDPNGRPTRMVGTNVDIDQVQREAERTDHLRERLELAVRGSGFGVWEMDLETNELIWDDRMHEIYGNSREDFDGDVDTWKSCLHQDDVQLVDERLAELMEGSRVELFEFRIRRADDRSERRIEANGYLQRDSVGKPQRLVGMNRDVTDRWRMDQRLRLLGTSLSNLQELILIAGANEVEQGPTIVFANDVFFSRTGFSVEDLDEISPMILCDQQNSDFAIRLLKDALKLGAAVRCDLLIKGKSGAPFWIDLQMIPIVEDNGDVSHWVMIGLEITGRKQAEAQMQQLNASLERRVLERTAALDDTVAELRTFTYSVSHDLHTPLRAIKGWTEALSQDCSQLLDDAGRSHLERIEQGAKHMGELIAGLQRLTRVSQADLEAVEFDLTPACRSIFERLSSIHPHRQVDLHLQPSIWVCGDASLLFLCMTNLIENAWKFTQTQAKPRIEVRCCRVDGDVRIEVQDNGVGFDMHFADSVWQPFKRINSDLGYQGSGIGLAVVDRIIRRHGGHTEATSTPGQGATFSLVLPQ